MALETVVFKQDPFDFCQKENNKIWGTFDSFEQEYCIHNDQIIRDMPDQAEEYFDQNEVIVLLDGDRDRAKKAPAAAGGGGGDVPMTTNVATTTSYRRKRKRAKSPKNEEDMENQRMTHIAVERNRRRQMNDYLSVLRSLMPPSYSQRGDQASVVGGAIDFVKELEQQHQFLEARKQKSNGSNDCIYSKLYTNSFTFPQYSTAPIEQQLHKIFSHEPVQKQSNIADIEVNIAENHANIKILTTKGSRQLVILVNGLHSLSLPILHLSITTVDPFVLYSFIVKVNDDSQLNSVNDIATAVHELVRLIKEEANHPQLSGKYIMLLG